MWEGIVGQEQPVDLLRRAVAQPVHAYLLVGPTGSGVSEAARCFAAALVCPRGGCGECSTCGRARRGRHPDVIEVEPTGTFIVVEQVEEIMREAFTSPFEAERKVIVIFEAERMNEPAANKLLKTLEEPPARTHFVLLAEAPDDLLPTVRSRCQRVDFSALSEEAVSGALMADGFDAEPAAAAARLSAGRVDRARALAGPWAPLRAAALAAATRLDGTGASVAIGAEQLGDALGGAVEVLEAAQKREALALETELVDAGYPDRLARRLRRDLEQRHQRAGRRARTDAVGEVITALETHYRDELVDRSAAQLPADEVLAALDACRAARSVLVNRTAVNEGLLLEHLLLQLPPGEKAGAG